MKTNKEEIKTNKFSLFMSDILMMPIWIKQLMYVYLRYRLEEELTPQYLSSYEIEDIFQLHKSVLTYKGKKELETKSGNLSDKFKILFGILIVLNKTASLLKSSLEVFVSGIYHVYSCGRSFGFTAVFNIDDCLDNS